MSHIADGLGDTQNEAGLLDVTGLTLTDLRELGQSALANAIRQVVDDVRNQREPHAGWQSYQR